MTMTGQELSNKIAELGITRQEASDLLGVSIRTLQYWTKKKEVKIKALELLEEKLGIKDCSPDVQNADMAQTQPAIFNTAKMQEPTLTQKSVALYEELIAQLKERIADQKRTITLLEKLLMRVIWEKTENGIPPAEKESPNTASLPQS